MGIYVLAFTSLKSDFLIYEIAELDKYFQLHKNSNKTLKTKIE